MSKISPELALEIDMIMELQKKLLSLSSETFDLVFDFIMNSNFIYSSERLQQLTSSIFILIEYRPWSIPYTAFLCKKLMDSAKPTNTLSKLKSDILFTIFTKERIKQENLHFLARCLESHFLYPQELVDFIHQFSIDRPGFVREILLYFAWFAPEIEMINQTLFNKFYCLYQPVAINTLENASNDEDDEEEDDFLGPELDNYFQMFEDLRKNNWDLLKKLRLNGCNHNEINIILKNDDLESLQQFAASQDFDFNQPSKPSIFELSMFCQTDPTIIQIAAFYGSVNCFKYLFLNGADNTKCDDEGKTTVQFAIAGGKNEIIRILQRENFDFSGAANIATLYHRNEIFRWIYDTIVNDVKFVDEGHGTLLESSCGSNNLEVFRFCMERGTDVNQKNSRVFFIFF